MESASGFFCPRQGFFLIRFENEEDREYFVNNGPWSIVNSLLVVDRWLPNTIVREIQLESFPLWVQYWGLPLEYHNEYVATVLGNQVGNTVTNEGGAIFSSSLNFLRVRVHINPMLPLAIARASPNL